MEIHVDDSTGPDISHLVAVDSSNLSEFTWLNSVATIFGEECRDRVIGEFECSLIVPGFREGRITAPRVDVVTPEVDSVISITAVEVMSQRNSDGGIIVGSITNTNLAVVLGLDIGLGITDRSFDESTGVGVVDFVGYLVTGEETEDVGVVGHGTER